VSDLDSVSIQARLIEILGPDIGPVVAREVIDRAIPAYANDDDCRQYAYQFFRRGAADPRIRRRRGRRKLTSRQALGVRLAIILHRAGVKLAKSHGGRRFDKSKTRGGRQFEKVLQVVFKAVDESAPDDLFDVIEPALKEMDYQLQHPTPASLARLDPNRPD
jgi:hypothetical protein